MQIGPSSSQFPFDVISIAPTDPTTSCHALLASTTASLTSSSSSASNPSTFTYSFALMYSSSSLHTVDDDDDAGAVVADDDDVGKTEDCDGCDEMEPLNALEDSSR